MSDQVKPIAAVEPKATKHGMSLTFQMYLCFTLAVACALTLCAAPRTLAPTELPALRLSRTEVEAVMLADAQAEGTAPRSPRALELERLFLLHGEAEDQAVESSDNYLRRRRALHAAYTALVREAGQDAALSLRARALGQLEAALDLRLPEAQVKGVMGVFANALQTHSVTRGGEEVAPHFVLRTLYKVRWNLAMGLPPDFAFAPVEVRTHSGWLALHAESLDLPSRLAALPRYAQAGGEHATEARGVLLFLAKEPALASTALQAAYEAEGNVRLRNYVLGARVAAGLLQPKYPLPADDWTK